VAIRVYWNAIQSHSQSEYDWSYIDQVAALAKQSGKQFSINITGGLNAPSWVYAIGSDGAGSHKFTISGSGISGAMPAPWDSNFQRRWFTFLATLANRYDALPNLSFVIVTGQGSGGQATLCRSQADNAELAADGGLNAWVNAFVSITGLYIKAFNQTPLIVNIGNPVFPRGLGGFKTANDLCVSTYGVRYGIKNNGLSPSLPVSGWQATEIKALSGSHPVGFQMLSPAGNANDLVQSIEIGKEIGAELFEVYPTDLALVSNFSSL
jgi:hypothetical protein